MKSGTKPAKRAKALTPASRAVRTLCCSILGLTPQALCLSPLRGRGGRPFRGRVSRASFAGEVSFALWATFEVSKPNGLRMNPKSAFFVRLLFTE